MITIAVSCKSDDDNNNPSTGLKFSNTNYSDMDNWLHFGGDPTKDVDIFVIYPTMAGVTIEEGLPYVNLNSTTMRERAN